MPDARVSTVQGREVTLKSEVLDKVRQGLGDGKLLFSGDPGYDQARTLWNAMIDRRPALIARCTGASDVILSVKFARENDLLMSVRGAGHNIAGNAACNGGLMLDLSPMKWVIVDPASRTVRVGPGATLGDVDRETQAFGLATPLGINSTTGVSGLTLGGGFGWLSRKYGLTVDSLLAADVVTADAKLMAASEKSNPDLFWGVRGGGGNFGVVTSFDFRLHPVGPELLCGLIVHPFADAANVLRQYRSFVSKIPDELTCWVVLRKAPPLPFLPAEYHGKEVVVFAVVYSGPIAEGEKLLGSFRKFGKPIADVIGPAPYAGFQKAFDPLLAPGARNYWKSHNFSELSDAALETLISFAGRLPTAASEIIIAQLGGAVNRVPADATAYPHRDANFVMNVHTRWEDPSLDGKCIAWAKEFFEASGKFATGGVYVNFISEGEERVASAFGANYDRLAKLKKKYDPTNFYRMNQNIRPAG